MWRAKGGIVLKIGDEKIPVKRWQDIDETYRLEPVYIEELEEKGGIHEFKPPPAPTTPGTPARG